MLTFVIPAAPYHQDVAGEAIASVQAQTLRCEYVLVVDAHRRGAGWARNEGLKQVTTPFVAFLDADDLLDPCFAEACLRAYDGKHYVFTDWYTDQHVEAPARPWAGDGTSHIVTTLLPTNVVRQLGAFDETLPGGEDTDLYWKLTRNGVCGKRLAQPLVYYRKGGQRAQTFVASEQYQTLMRAIVTRYEGLPMSCQDCGGNLLDMDVPPSGEQLEGDVLAEALWKGERPERGRVSRRIYRGGWNSKLWVDPRDIDAAPHLFARVVEMPGKPTESDFQRWAKDALYAASGKPSQPDILPVPAAPVSAPVKADVSKVLRLARQQP